MAYMNITQTRGRSQGFLSRVAADLAGRWARYSVYRKTLSELQSLSVRDLNDLGLNKSTVRRTAYEAAYGK